MNDLLMTDNALANVRFFGEDIDPSTGEVLSDATEEQLIVARAKAAEAIMLSADVLRNEVSEIDAKIAMFKEAIEALKKKKDELSSRLEETEAPIISSIEKFGDIECDGYTITTHKKPPAVLEVDASQTPGKYMKTTVPKPVTKPDKVAIKKAIMAGEYVPGWAVTQGFTLVCKEG